ncbi:DNA-directed DNA polymerase alpha [Spraguea lophii 42_110]|uniref:DNA polymerase n=1 Tax=Spraguea lophii (strain 42_110) TaxID=1358809 RepID=S7WAQ0_SPRLO|nr:DNA-directed DNA polymerase alpha [Spraguea lophii 42_110]
MFFYLYTIEQINDHSVYLYGKRIKNTNNDIKIDPSKYESVRCRIKVENIISPSYIVSKSGKTENLIKDLLKYFNMNKLDFEFEKVVKKNYFYNDMVEDLECIKVYGELKGFHSEFLQNIIVEFYSPVENIIISKSIKGPGILKIDNYIDMNTNEYIAEIENINFIENTPFPNLNYISLTLKENISCVKAYGKRNDLIIGGCNKKYYGRRDFAYHPTSSAMLKHVMAIVNNINPDVILFHNTEVPFLKNSGRILCDIFNLATTLVKGRSFSIDELRKTLLNQDNKYGSSDEIQKIVDDTESLMDILIRMDGLELSKQMTEICGNLLNRTLKNMRAERNEYFILHEIYKRNCLFPPRNKEMEVGYSGGLVLEPKKGYYESAVLLLDFVSLYPSIIQEFNICFSTVGKINHVYKERIKDEEFAEEDIESLVTEAKNAPEGFLPQIIRSIIQRRKKVKELMKKCSEDERKTLENRQKALKLTANSIYGCLGASISRFYNITMALLITSKGREILKNTKYIAENELKLDVIYGDTDSLMINTHLDGIENNLNLALEQSIKLKERINKKYTKIELEMDNIFKKLIIYNKKKYAALLYDGKLETKGLDTNRRDFCPASNKFLTEIIELLLFDFEKLKKTHNQIENQPKNTNVEIIKTNGHDMILSKIYNKLTDLKDNIRTYHINDFIIDATLSRNPENYKTPEALPHVHLALKLKEKGYKYKKGDIVSYVVGESQKNTNITQKAYLASDNVPLDYNYYIENQILNPLYRILNYFENINFEKINSIFGIEKKKVITPHNVTLLTPCCENVQKPGWYCLKCKNKIEKGFFIKKVYEMVRKEISLLYNPKNYCSTCEIERTGIVPYCLDCNTKLTFTAKNKEFDEFLNSIEDSFRELELEEIKNYINEIYKKSGYRVINLKKYFS